MVMHLLTEELSVQLAGTAIFMLLRLGHVHAHVTPPHYTIINTTIYLSNITQPDIAYAIRQLARIMAKPNTYYLLIAKGLLQYLKGIAKAKITY